MEKKGRLNESFVGDVLSVSLDLIQDKKIYFNYLFRRVVKRILIFKLNKFMSKKEEKKIFFSN